MRRALLQTASIAVLVSGPLTAWSAPEPAAAALKLVAQARVEADGAVALKATFASADGGALTFFVPQDAGALAFPAWRAVREDGAEFRPYDAPFQSMWTEGDLGSLVVLSGAGTWESSHTASLWVRAEAAAEADAWLTPLPLAPGRYRLRCAYEQKDATIPVAGPAFTTSTRTVKGLWTGRAEAPPIDFEVARRPVVSLSIDGPREVPVAGAYGLTLVLRNDTATAQRLTGVLTLSASSKPEGTANALLLLGEPPRALAPGESQTLELAPGAERRVTVDLGVLTWTQQRHKARAGRLADLLGQGVFHLQATFGTAGSEVPLTSNGLWRYVAPATPAR